MGSSIDENVDNVCLLVFATYKRGCIRDLYVGNEWDIVYGIEI